MALSDIHAGAIREYVNLYGPSPVGEHQRIVLAAVDGLEDTIRQLTAYREAAEEALDVERAARHECEERWERR